MYEEHARSIGRLVDQKNKAYGDSFRNSGDILRILYPDGIKPEQYDDMLALARIIDKMFRIATNRDAFSENPYVDIAGYAILRSKQIEEEKKEKEIKIWR
ncbi:MAG: hypothetical protein B5M53_07545 [Candidatus Cloacimonas sp. 4484_209]|nr:MAG: hypothetical protein B5M53_07545 [Candidatus Cloacimonas sp. 4484_209]